VSLLLFLVSLLLFLVGLLLFLVGLLLFLVSLLLCAPRALQRMLSLHTYTYTHIHRVMSMARRMAQVMPVSMR
jgi:hypothetical protein